MRCWIARRCRAGEPPPQRQSPTAAARLRTDGTARRVNRFKPTARAGLAVRWFFGSAVTAQYLRQVLRKRRARHHHVTSGFLRFHLQFALDVRDKADDVGGLLQLRLQFGDDAQRLGRGIVQVEDDERRLVFAVLAHAVVQVFLRLHELDLHVHLARRLLDLRQEEQVIDEGKDARRLLFRSHGQRLGFGRHELLAKAWPSATAAALLVQVAVVVALGVAIAVVHGRGVDAAAGQALPSGACAMLATVALGRPMALRLSGMLRGGIRDGSTAAAPPSASLPAGLSGGRIRSLIHASLLIVVTRRWRAPTFVNRCSRPRTRKFSGCPDESAVVTSLKSNQLRPSGAWQFGARNACTGSAAIGGRSYRTQL